jgi:hypothetical protein
LEEFSINGDGLFKVEDTGGAFGPGEPRFDVFYEDKDEGADFYSRTYDIRREGGSVVYVFRSVPPTIEEVSGQ